MHVVQATFEATTQLAKADKCLPLRRHFKSRFPQANVNRLLETFSTDTMFSSTKVIGGETMCQMFSGNKSKYIKVYGFSRQTDGLDAYKKFIKDVGAPDCLHRDNHKLENSAAWHAVKRTFDIKSTTTKPHNQQQNPCERMIQTCKAGVNKLMDRSGAPKCMWFLCLLHFISVWNCAAHEDLGNRTPTEKALGFIPDISPLLCFHWWESVYYLDYEAPTFPASKEKKGFYCGAATNCGDIFTHKIYVPNTRKIIHRSVVQSAATGEPEQNLCADNPHYNDDSDEDDGKTSLADDESIISEIIHEDLREQTPIPDDSDILLSPSESNTDITGDIICLSEIIGVTKFQDLTKKYGELPDPSDIIGATFPILDDNGHQHRVEVKNLQDEGGIVEFQDGSRKLLEYNIIIDKLNAPKDDSKDFYSFKGILGHRKVSGNWEVQVNWEGIGQVPTREPLKHMKKEYIFSVAEYARDNDLLNTQGWKWAKNIKVDRHRIYRMLQRALKAVQDNSVKYMFGVPVPRDVNEALQFDKSKRNNLWQEAIDKEMSQIMEYETFKILGPGEEAPEEYNEIPLRLVFAVKHDGRRKARLVAGVHVTTPPTEDIYSSVVQPESVRLVLFMGALCNLDIMGGDIGNAYLHGHTKEKVWTQAGPEFGTLKGRVLLCVKSLYGLKTSQARWAEHLCDSICSLGWFPSHAENDVWLQDKGDYYELLATYSDGLLVASRNAKSCFDEFEKLYTLKGVGFPEYFIGAKLIKVKGEYNEKGETYAWSAGTYLDNCIENIERVLDCELRNYTCPINQDYHPKLDESELLDREMISQYRMLFRCAQWAITLGRIDITYTVSIMSRYNMMPRIGHVMAMKQLFGYLKGHKKGRIIFDPRPLDISKATFEDAADWKRIYGEIKEEMPPNLIEPKMKEVFITVYFDAAFANDMLARRSTTGIIVFLSSTPVKWVCKRQNTIETSTYGSELVACRLAIEILIEYRIKMRKLGCKMVQASVLLGDNKSQITNCSLPSSGLKKKHNAIAYHRIREMVAAEIAQLGHISSEENYAYLRTKALNGPKLHGLCKGILFKVT